MGVVMKFSHRVVSGLLLMSYGIIAVHAADSAVPATLAIADKPVQIAVPAQPVEAALNEFARQSGVHVVIDSRIARGLSSAAVQGRFRTEEALLLLLQSTGLTYKVLDERTIAVVGPIKSSAAPAAATTMAGEQLRLVHAETPESARTVAGLPSARDAQEGSADESPDTKGTPEILVQGRRSLNMDIERTEDAPQPYVVFDREDLQRSQASSLEEFLRTRLPMNAIAGSNSQTPGGATNASFVNLRGLGPGQTLILVDGRRMPGRASLGIPLQPDLNGIPLGAIERIEVLPSTAGGIYGGSATGGVINIILRRDYQGLEVKADYANTFDTDAGSMRFDASAGFSLEGGRTRVMVTAAHMDSNKLLIGDREFAERSIGLQLRNNPGVILDSFRPPLGATVNIRSLTGTLTLDDEFGGASLDSAITHLPLGYVGPASDSGAALLANAGQYNLELSNDLNALGRGLRVAPKMESVSLNVRREFSRAIEAFVDFSHFGNKGRSQSAGLPNSVSNLSGDAPNNPFKEPISVRFPVPGLAFENRTESTSLRATAGLIFRLPHHWTGELDFGWSRARFELASTGSVIDFFGDTALRTGQPSADGRPALNVLQEGNTFPIDFSPYLMPSPNSFGGPYDSILKNATVRVSGPALDMPGGSLNLTALIERRTEELQDAYFEFPDTFTGGSYFVLYPHSSQRTDSVYLEARAPLVSADSTVPLLRELELQASVRRDEYAIVNDGTDSYSATSRDDPGPARNYATTHLSSTDYTLGFRYVPHPGVTLRASVGTGFLPPDVQQLGLATPVEYFFSYGVTDPMRGDTDSFVGEGYTVVVGGNPALRPEQSDSWSAGVILEPQFLPGLRLSMDYTSIDKVDEIQSPDLQVLLDYEASFPGRIVRGENMPGDPAGWAGPVVFFDTTALNAASTSVKAYDVQLDYTWSTARFGDFHGYLLATRQTRFANRALPIVAVADSVGFDGGPLKLRGNAGLDWDRGPLTLTWNAQYYNDYYVYTATSSAPSIAAAILNQGAATIPRQMYHDFGATYRFDAATGFGGGLLANTQVSVGIQNVFGKVPPILAATSVNALTYSTYGDPRLRRYTISIRKGFN